MASGYSRPMHIRRAPALAVWLLATSLSAIAASDDTPDDAPPSEGVKNYDIGPRIVKQTKPRYPGRAFQKGLEGTVDVEFVIEATGEVRRARVISSMKPPRPDLEQATKELVEEALATVRKWRFEPALKDGQPVATVARAPVTFKRK